MYKEKRSSQAVRLWFSSQCTYWTLGWFLAGCLVIGLFPQLSVQETAEKSGIFSRLGCYNFMSSWIFVTGLFALLTHLGMITLKRGFLPGRNRWRFVLNHAGLWLALFAGVIGSAEEQTLRIPVFRDSPSNEAYSEQGTKVYLPKALQLTDFAVDYYPNGNPRHFSAEVSVDGQPVHLEVNHPYAANWAEDYYLTSYDVQSPQPRYCVVQIVREPLKHLMWLGIVMMLCGSGLLFLAGPDRRRMTSY
ncbi:cytochrome c biogenesis protein ResB [Bacteroides mediterraneensis]|uniref:cytochrome c biogenesis protein ResB n=1 Tax=Bacteroides mediterraneensis TaxID=1841856 RepID=UPI001F47C5FE|nr:cytochrome c biogenesis protein ResB [Bacteroides mediterraneensis]